MIYDYYFQIKLWQNDLSLELPHFAEIVDILPRDVQYQCIRYIKNIMITLQYTLGQIDFNVTKVLKKKLRPSRIKNSFYLKLGQFFFFKIISKLP